MKRMIVFLIRVYQKYWSSWHPPVCRFTPSCSQYAIEALLRYGIWRGSFFILRRLLRCHPWCAGGYDPVP